ncbi:MAG TPA: glycine--tRNA ligase subunit beta [Vicinamibacterales bacterium]|nr:glycine--tRNA ligase subunit beta [Vicinamibacterales bacterium]
MDRELLLEIGCEEIPASWLPGLTNQVGEVLAAQLRERRLSPETPVETYSTPRRLTVRIQRIPERQSDFEEVINGPAASAPEAAIAGFTAKHGIDASVLEKIETPKGVYLAYRRKVRGKTAVDVLPEVLGATLRALAFPKLMHWDAMLEDGKGELLFGRPIRWLLYTYGGRVVPFSIARTAAAQTSQVQEVSTGAATYGHRFLTTSGRAGRAIKVRSFEEYRARLLENFVILERSERHNKIARELDAKAQRLQGRVSRVARHDSSLLDEVPDLVEYPSVVAGTFAREFLELPEEVLTTTLIHHQHYFPVEGEDGRLKEAFLAVINIEPDNERTIARNAERVVTARLRDARFFWEADRKVALESRIERLSTLLFHKKLGSYKDKAIRIETLARWIAKEAFGATDEAANQAALAARLAKTDLATDMVREFPELQGVMGGVYARAEGQPEEVWKAIYHHYLPHGVEADAPPSPKQLGKAAVTWASVSLADKLDTIVGLFAAGEKPTGSRDPFGLRRAAQGVMKILTDVPAKIGVGDMIARAHDNYGAAARVDNPDWLAAVSEFLMERQAHLIERRGFRNDEARAVSAFWKTPHAAVKRVEALSKERGSDDFAAVAALLKRVKNITRDQKEPSQKLADLKGRLKEPAEVALATEIDARSPKINEAKASERYADAMKMIVGFREPVDRFFTDVLVMAEDPQVRKDRLALLTMLRDAITQIADISEMAAEEKQA